MGDRNGGDRLVAHVAGRAAEAALGDEVRRRHPHHLDRLFGAITPTEGAGDLLETLRRHRIGVVLATSGERELTDRLLELVPGSRELIGHTVTGTEAEESKPHGELMRAAVAAGGSRRAVAIGNAVWDVAAASDAGLVCIGLLTGGITEAELAGAGTVAVYETPGALAAHVETARGLQIADGA